MHNRDAEGLTELAREREREEREERQRERERERELGRNERLQ
jgi:hypothetical protein